jgi:hypothetical protein
MLPLKFRTGTPIVLCGVTVYGGDTEAFYYDVTDDGGASF